MLKVKSEELSDLVEKNVNAMLYNRYVWRTEEGVIFVPYPNSVEIYDSKEELSNVLGYGR